MKRFINIIENIILDQVGGLDYTIDPKTGKDIEGDYSLEYLDSGGVVKRSTNCLIKTAEKYIDKSVYTWGAGPENPNCVNEPGKSCEFDCSSFVNHVFEECGYTVDIPRTTNGMWAQITAGTGGAKKRNSESEVRVGDFVFFDTQPTVGPVGHVALIVNTSPLEMIHSCSRGVVKDNVKSYASSVKLVGYGSYL